MKCCPNRTLLSLKATDIIARRESPGELRLDSDTLVVDVGNNNYPKIFRTMSMNDSS